MSTGCPRRRAMVHALSICVLCSARIASAISSESQLNTWEFDTTIAMIVAFVWWLAEYCSNASQRLLFYTSDFNVAWSLLTILLVVFAVLTAVGEQILRKRFNLSLPTTIATLVAASLSYILLPDRLPMFDCHARLTQAVLRAPKLRFGRPGPANSERYVIEWRRWQRGDPAETWRGTKSSAFPKAQVLLDWGLEHRLGTLTSSDCAERMRQGTHSICVMIGELLYCWLPSASFNFLVLKGRWRERGRLRGGYGSNRGHRLGLPIQGLAFEDWLDVPNLSPAHFQLISVEYPIGTRTFVRRLASIVHEAATPEETAEIFMRRWDEAIEESRALVVSQGAAPDSNGAAARV